MHRFFTRDVDRYFDGDAIPVEADRLAERHLHLWSSPKHREREIARMRQSNAEWDFMARTYFVLALANMAELTPGRRDSCLDVIDTIIDETMRHGRARRTRIRLRARSRTALRALLSRFCRHRPDTTTGGWHHVDSRPAIRRP